MNKKVTDLLLIIICIASIFSMVVNCAGIHIYKNNSYMDSKVLNIKEAAEYMNIPENTIAGIIEIEGKKGIVSPIYLPYFKVDEEYFFVKDSLDKWLLEVTDERRSYDLTSRKYD